ncbi:unnamed protein product [Porites lobata]|uniref:Uncharacterized protein n=1 Tax=Porites lobata TaxID=104759 RepID=A0ABN8RAH2_9CNID|nr:unnamed protein product [Porites lobata]
MQSAYRKYHSTKTALIRIVNDIQRALDDQCESILDVITAHCLNAMMYADDSQLYIIVRQSNRATALKDLTLCIEDIMSWNVSNMLKCNPKKTDPSQLLHRSS